MCKYIVLSVLSSKTILLAPFLKHSLHFVIHFSSYIYQRPKDTLKIVLYFECGRILQTFFVVLVSPVTIGCTHSTIHVEADADFYKKRRLSLSDLHLNDNNCVGVQAPSKAGRWVFSVEHLASCGMKITVHLLLTMGVGRIFFQEGANSEFFLR